MDGRTDGFFKAIQDVAESKTKTLTTLAYLANSARYRPGYNENQKEITFSKSYQSQWTITLDSNLTPVLPNDRREFKPISGSKMHKNSHQQYSSTDMSPGYITRRSYWNKLGHYFDNKKQTSGWQYSVTYFIVFAFSS
jgi:hypothetical protein